MQRYAFIAVVIALTSTGCPTVDLGDEPPDPGQCRPDPGYYETVIWPEFLAPADPQLSCVGEAQCHRADNGTSGFRLETDPVDHNDNYNSVIRRLNCGTPEASRLLTRPAAGVDTHGGGDMFELTSPQAQIFLDWFAL